jgi:hypothetical protein
MTEINLEYIIQTKQRLDNIKQKAIKINNTISGLDHDCVLRYNDCRVDGEWLNIELTEYNHVRLSYLEPYEAYSSYWEIPFNLFDFSDEELVVWFESEIEKVGDRQRDRDIANLKIDAEQLGYKLVKIEGETL